MKKIRCIVVDDEPLARELIALYVQKQAGWELQAACRSVAEAYEALYQHDVDVIFLDINLPDKTGTAFLATLKNPPHVVFTTAYDEYAARAFDLHAADYLVKPITQERFSEAVEKVERLMQVPHDITPPATAFIFLKQDTRLVKVLFDDILYVEALKDFSKVFLKQGKPMLISTHLKGMEDLLPKNRFLRMHRSYIVALQHITAVQGNMVEIGGQQLPVGSSYKDSLMKSLGLTDK